MRHKVRQAVVPSPCIIACDLRPLVVVPRLAAHINHAIDTAATAQYFAARVAQLPAVKALVGLGFVQPVGAWVAYAVQITHRNMNPVVIIFAACFNQQYALSFIAAQAVGQQAACGTTANDDVVESGVRHVWIL